MQSLTLLELARIIRCVWRRNLPAVQPAQLSNSRSVVPCSQFPLDAGLLERGDQLWSLEFEGLGFNLLDSGADESIQDVCVS